MNILKIKINILLPWLGIVFGVILTALLWLEPTPQIYSSLRWISYAGMAGMGLYLLAHHSRRRAFLLLALLASVSIVYLFPELFGPACNGIPKALASPLYGGPCGRDCNLGCCVNDQCSKCPEEEEPVTLPPSLSATVLCAQSGSNGWCRDNAQLKLTISDPQGYALTLKGSAGSVPIDCNKSCTINLPPGFGTASYTVTAATSGIRVLGSKAWHYDPDPPISDVNISGTSGANGWYVSLVTASADGSDAISGVAGTSLSVDGGVIAGAATLSEGVHSVTATAQDVAGNSASETLMISVDTLAPIISISAAGTRAQNGWYSTKVNLSATATDATSGVAGSVSMSFDNGVTWVTGPRTLGDGLYDVRFRVSDRAGNTATSQMSLKIDTQPPTIVLSESGAPGRDGWYVSDATVSAAISDNLANVASIQYRVNGIAWQDGNAVTVGEGVYTIEFQAFDVAGNRQVASREIRVDTTPPAYTFNAALNGAILADIIPLGGTASDGTSGVRDVEFSPDGKDWFPASHVDTRWSFAWDSTVFDNGERVLYLKVEDVAGNQGVPIPISVILDNDPPYVQLAETWNIWESGDLAIFNNVIPLESIRIVVHDPLRRFADQVIYDNLPAPAAVEWDRGIGSASAPPGSYTVTVEVCDIYGLCSKDTGTILIPAVPTPAPLIQSPVIEIPEWIPPLPILPAPEPPGIVPTPIAVPIQEQAQVIPSLPPRWPLITIGAFLLAFAFLLLTDPRPSALRSLTHSIHQHLGDLLNQ